MADDLKIPLEVHEGLITRHDVERPAPSRLIPVDPNDRPDPEIAAMGSAMAYARQQAASILEVRKRLQADATLTPEAQALRLRSVATQAASAVATRLDASRAQASAAVEASRAAINRPPAPRDSVALGLETEIRSSLKAMDDDQRAAVIATAFEQKDLSVIGAVLRGPSFLSGLAPSKLPLMQERYAREFHGDEFERTERRAKALEQFDRSGGSFLRFTQKLVSDPVAKLAEANLKAREEAEAALQTQAPT